MNHYHPILSPGFLYAFFVPIFHQSMKIYTLSGYNLSLAMRLHRNGPFGVLEWWSDGILGVYLTVFIPTTPIFQYSSIPAGAKPLNSDIIYRLQKYFPLNSGNQFILLTKCFDAVVVDKKGHTITILKEPLLRYGGQSRIIGLLQRVLKASRLIGLNLPIP